MVQDDIEYTASLVNRWLKLCLDAKQFLGGDKFEMWKFMVGESESLKDRIILGTVAFNRLTHRPYGAEDVIREIENIGKKDTSTSPEAPQEDIA